ncbi:mycothiol transferase [Streptomyces sp. NPDC054887]
MPGRRVAQFTGADGEQRFSGPPVGDERSMLAAVPDARRATLELKCAGPGTEPARRSVSPSSLSPLGLVRHLADVERRWFRAVLAGQDAELRFSSADASEGDFDGAGPVPGASRPHGRPGGTRSRAARAFVAGAPHLDVEGHDGRRGRVCLRRVLVHMIEEYARPNGHADLIRERIDGAVGV